MTLFQTVAALLSVAAFAGYVNHRLLRLPATIGLMAVALACSLALVLLDDAGVIDVARAAAFVRSIDFGQTLLHGMLAFLLFAGAMHVDPGALRRRRFPVLVLSTIGVLVAMLVTGWLFQAGAALAGLRLPFIQALLFGALISPTDPISVLGIMRRVGAPPHLETDITGESLFNDGVGVVAFLTVLGVASGHGLPQPGAVALFLGVQTLGGLAFGAALGWIFLALLRTVDDYRTEALLTLALAAGGYALAEMLHVSAPIAIVVAGLVIGSRGRGAMSAQTRERLDPFWELVDEVMNAVLFLLIGLEFLTVRFTAAFMAAGALAIGAVLIGRLLSVSMAAGIIRLRMPCSGGDIAILTWGGLRGGLSIALALALPESPAKDLLLSATCIVVAFSILVQGLSLGRVIRFVLSRG